MPCHSTKLNGKAFVVFQSNGQILSFLKALINLSNIPPRMFYPLLENPTSEPQVYKVSIYEWFLNHL